MINLKELKQRLAELEEMKFGPGLDDFGSAHQLELIGWCRDLIEEVERLRKLPNIGRELSNLEPDNKVLHLKNKENAAQIVTLMHERDDALREKAELESQLCETRKALKRAHYHYSISGNPEPCLYPENCGTAKAIASTPTCKHKEEVERLLDWLRCNALHGKNCMPDTFCDCGLKELLK